MRIKKTTLPSPCKSPTTYYLWLGGSCDYGHPERYGGGAYMLEYGGDIIDQYVISDVNTTEFRMMLTVMLHALESLPAQSDICFLTNVSYLQNFDKTPTATSANADLINSCITAKQRHNNVTLRLLPYHKYPQMPEAHRIAHEAMLALRQPGNR